MFKTSCDIKTYRRIVPLRPKTERILYSATTTTTTTTTKTTIKSKTCTQKDGWGWGRTFVDRPVVIAESIGFVFILIGIIVLIVRSRSVNNKDSQKSMTKEILLIMIQSDIKSKAFSYLKAGPRLSLGQFFANLNVIKRADFRAKSSVLAEK